jgi:hypothetical protein
VVDVTAHIDTVVAAMSANKAQGPGGSTGSQLKMRLAAEGRRLPALEGEDGSDEAADRAYVRLFLLEHARELGATYALEYAEPFYCTPPPDTLRIDQYIAQHAIKLQP